MTKTSISSARSQLIRGSLRCRSGKSIGIGGGGGGNHMYMINAY